jgi:hypothetical protein
MFSDSSRLLNCVDNIVESRFFGAADVATGAGDTVVGAAFVGAAVVVGAFETFFGATFFAFVWASADVLARVKITAVANTKRTGF